ncbi:MAG: hypothetical protein J7L94_09645 [Caldisericaceae bacterium]|nr:hypothetical protein [Caldisericaceae bacterium]
MFKALLTAGRHQFNWNALDLTHRSVSSGLYFVTIRNKKGEHVRQKILLIG